MNGLSCVLLAYRGDCPFTATAAYCTQYGVFSTTGKFSFDSSFGNCVNEVQQQLECPHMISKGQTVRSSATSSANQDKGTVSRTGEINKGLATKAWKAIPQQSCTSYFEVSELAAWCLQHYLALTTLNRALDRYRYSLTAISISTGCPSRIEHSIHANTSLAH